MMPITGIIKKADKRTEVQTVINSGQLIRFTLTRKHVRNINIRMKPDMSVTVSAAPGVPLAYIKTFVTGKAPWILRNMEKYSKMKSLPSFTHYGAGKFDDGDKVFLAGQPMLIRLTRSEYESVSVNSGQIVIGLRDLSDTVKRRKLAGSFFKDIGTQIFEESIKEAVRVAGLHFMPYIRIRNMKSRWGSCNISKRSVTMNAALVHLPRECIDYVAAHEIAHFRHPGHGKDFYSALSAVMPDWKARKKALASVIISP